MRSGQLVVRRRHVGGRGGHGDLQDGDGSRVVGDVQPPAVRALDRARRIAVDRELERRVEELEKQLRELLKK